MKPTAGALAGAGFSLASGTTYKKVTGTATAIGDTSTGQVAIAATTPGTPIAAADWAANVTTLASLGLVSPESKDFPNYSGGTTYVGFSTS